MNDVPIVFEFLGAQMADPRTNWSLGTHAATELVPEGWIPCAHLYPAHPAKDAFGRPHPFDPARHHAFQKMLQDFGDPKFYTLKQQVLAAVAAGEDPSVIAIEGDRFARTSIRVALRQLKAADGMSPSLMMWLSAHERPIKSRWKNKVLDVIRAAIAGACPHYPESRIADISGRLRSARSRSIGRSGFFSASVRPNGLLSKSVASWDVGCIRDVDEPSVMSRM